MKKNYTAKLVAVLAAVTLIAAALAPLAFVLR